MLAALAVLLPASRLAVMKQRHARGALAHARVVFAPDQDEGVFLVRVRAP
jgi:hypothetical protein